MGNETIWKKHLDKRIRELMKRKSNEAKLIKEALEEYYGKRTFVE